MRSIRTGAVVVAGLLLASSFGHVRRVSAGSDMPERTVRTADAVLLDFDLGPITGDASVYRRGSVVALSRIANGHVAGADACSNRHLHANAGTLGIKIDGHGPYPDPNGTECGYGSVEERPVAELSLMPHRSGALAYLTGDGEPRFQLELLVKNSGPESADSVRVSIVSPSACPVRSTPPLGLFDVASESSEGAPYRLEVVSRTSLAPNTPDASYYVLVHLGLNPAFDCTDAALVFDATVSTTSVDPDPTNNATRISIATERIEAQRIVEFPPEAERGGTDLPPGNVRLVQLTPGVGAVAVSTWMAAGTAAAPDGASPTGYRLYGSPQPGVQPIPDNLLAAAPDGQTFFDVTERPAGWYYVVTTVGDAGESAPSAEVGGTLPTVASIRVTGSKIVVTGTGFAAGTTVRLDGLGFSRPAKIKNGRKVTQKGSLETGQSLGELVGQTGSSGILVLELEDGRGNIVVVAYER